MSQNTSKSRSKRDQIYKGPRKVLFSKTETGFGFNVRGQVSEGGQLKSINGVLYAPLQHVSAILEGGAAEKAGVRPGDRILEVNGVDVEGATHKRVVDLIKAGGDDLSMTVISVPARDFQRLDPDDDFFYDYSDIKRLDITIPNYEHIGGEEGNKYVVYMVVVDGRMVVKRRYSEFLTLHDDLQKIFKDFDFPKFPGKWPFQMSEVQLEKRRYQLENYLSKTFRVRVIQECDLVLDFLNLDTYGGDGQPETHEYNPDIEIGKPTESDNSAKRAEKAKRNDPLTSPSPPNCDEEDEDAASTNHVEEEMKCRDDQLSVRLLLPNRKRAELTSSELKRSASRLLSIYLDELDVDEKLHQLFAIFKFDENEFYCKLASDDQLSDHLPTKDEGEGFHFAIRKWIFNIKQEQLLLATTDHLKKLLTGLAFTDVKNGTIQVSSRQGPQLKLFASQDKHNEYLECVSKAGDYSSVTFPHCACDSRKQGHVIVRISFDHFKLFACTEDGHMESQVIDFAWAEMKEWSHEESVFRFHYQRADKKPRWVKIYSPYASYMHECFARVMDERMWIEELKSDSDRSKGNVFVEMDED